jgi:hypothetical protein
VANYEWCRRHSPEKYEIEIGGKKIALNALTIKESKEFESWVAREFGGIVERLVVFDEEGNPAGVRLTGTAYELARETMERLTKVPIAREEWEDSMTNFRIREMFRAAIEVNDLRWLQDLVAASWSNALKAFPDVIDAFARDIVERIKKNLMTQSSPSLTPTETREEPSEPRSSLSIFSTDISGFDPTNSRTSSPGAGYSDSPEPPTMPPPTDTSSSS